MLRRVLTDALLRLTVKRQWRSPVDITTLRQRSARSDHLIGPGRRGALATRLQAGNVEADVIGDIGLGARNGVLLYLHGGAFCFHLPLAFRRLAAELATRTGMAVVLPDYRLAPEHPYPAAVDDVLAAYRWLLDRGVPAHRLAVAGDSAGGNLTLVLLMRLRELGLPLPAAAVTIAPLTDMTGASPSIIDNESSDCLFDRNAFSMLALYAGSEPLASPGLSPLFGNWQGLPPLQFHVSSTEMLRDDSFRAVERVKAAGGSAELVLWPGMPHVFQVFPWLEETGASLDRIAAFLRLHALAKRRSVAPEAPAPTPVVAAPAPPASLPVREPTMDLIFDFVVVGGGASGAVVASRLSEDPAVRVCLLEAGGGGEGPLVRTPVGFVVTVPSRVHNWAMQTEPQLALNGRLGYRPAGRVLGGSSSINAMCYTRGHRWDYDHWAALGNPGWAYDDVLPLFRRAEHNTRLSGPWHGQEGPLWVSDGRSGLSSTERFLEAARQSGFALTDDLNTPEPEGIGRYQVMQRDGQRCSVAAAYLVPNRGRPNLRIITGAMVDRVLMDGTRAVGVACRIDGHASEVRAAREVVLCAGALRTPQVLMLSGIGDPAELQRHGIAVRQALPGVGRNLQDHPDLICLYRSGMPDLFGMSLAGSLRMVREFVRYLRQRDGMISTNFAEAGGFLKSRPDVSIPDIQTFFAPAMVEDHGRRYRMGHGFSVHTVLLRPRSRGRIGLRAASPDAAPLIEAGLLTDPQDLDDMVAGYKQLRRIVEAPALRPFVREDILGSQVRNDDDIRTLLRSRVDAAYHPAGTCAMGTGDDAVVDARLRVRGLSGLRVADASIMPTLVGANTTAPCVMIGEKAADLMREDHAMPQRNAVATAN